MSAKHVRLRTWRIGKIAAVALIVFGTAYTAGQLSTGAHTSNQLVAATPTVTATVTEYTTVTKTVTASVTRSVTKPSRSTSRKPISTRALGAQTIAKELLAKRGWSGQWTCLNNLVNRESGWNIYAKNPSSGAYGIPQALPAGKMASAGADWRTNPRTQLSWMMGYIEDRYSTPCGAWAHSQRTGWY